jgi:hypothetical protein
VSLKRADGTTKKYVLFGGMILACTSFAGLAGATTITSSGMGILNVGNGAVQVSGNGLTSGCIDWYNTTTAPSGCQPAGTTGSLTVNGSSTGPFAAGQTGTIQDLNFNTALPLVDFIKVNLGGGSTAHFDLIGLRFNAGANIGDCGASNGPDGKNNMSPGVTCSPANSPFQITNGLANGSGVVDTATVSFSFDAYGYTGTSGVNYNAADRYVGIVTTQGALSGSNIADILQTIGQGGAVSASWSATLSPVSAAPEPGSYVMLGLGLISLATMGRRSRNRAKN